MANEIRLRANNISGTTTDNPLTAGATTINSPGFVDLPVVNTTNHLILVLDPLETAGQAEIVQVTAHAASASSVTVVRGFETTTPRQHNLGTTWFHGPVVSDYNYTQRTALSSNRPASPVNGELIYETDTNKYVGRSSAGTWESVMPLGAWTSFSPTIVQGVTPAQTLINARYFQVGKMATALVVITFQGAGTAGQIITLNGVVPTAIAGSNIHMGTFRYFDAGNTNFVGAVVTSSSTAVSFNVNGDGNPFGIGAPTIANGDFIQIGYTYETV